MRLEIKILNNTTGERVYAISEGSIDGAIAHLGAFERHVKWCEVCGEPMKNSVDFESDYCSEFCVNGMKTNTDEGDYLHNPF